MPLVVHPSGTAWPDWATADLPNADVNFIQNWISAGSWAERETAIVG